MINSAKIKEPDAKAILIDYLIKTGKVKDDSVLIPEMRVAYGDRRVDLVLANGELHGFEIKSDADRLDRLAGQIESMMQRFERVTVVTTSKHLEQVRAVVPEQVGIMLLSRGRNQTKLKNVRKAKRSNLAREVLLKFLTVSGIREILRHSGYARLSKLSRSSLERLATEIKMIELRLGVLTFIKKKFRNFHEIFLQKRNEKTELIDLKLFHRTQPQQRRSEPPKDTKVDLANYVLITLSGNGLLVRKRLCY